MSILNVENVSHDFGGRTILENASFRLLNGEHIGLVGANGEGKSTFLNIITGKLAPDSGKIEWCKRITTGYLDQHTVLKPGQTIYEVLQDAFKYYYDLEQEMLSMYEQMADCDDKTMNKLMDEVGEIQEILDHGGFYTIDVKIKEVAGGLGLNDIGLDKPVDALSGGQRSEDGILTRYKGDYDYYLQQVELKKRQQVADYQKQQKEIADLEDFIARNKARVATRNMASSRQKKLDKMNLISKPKEKVKPVFSFLEARTPGKVLFECKDLVIGYDTPLTKPMNLVFERNKKRI